MHRARERIKRALHRFPRLYEAVLAVYYRLRPLPGASPPGEGERPSLSGVFSDIYRDNGWGDEESRSGPGSTLRHTERLRIELPVLLKDLEVTTLLDAPCGDFNWMRTVSFEPGLSYIGGDIVPSLIERLQSEEQTDKHTFICLDVVHDELPSADLWFCRDCWMHLPNDAVIRALENFAKSDIAYLLTTSFNIFLPNVDIEAGSCRMLNLGRAPFSLPRPLRSLWDTAPPFAPHHLHLYSNAQIREWAESRARQRA